MSAQKNKTVLAATLAIIAVFLLGGVSFSFFPVHQPSSLNESPSAAHILWTKPTASNNSLIITGPSNSSGPNYYFVITRHFPMDTICINSNGDLNSTSAPIRQQGNIYTLTGSIVNRQF